MDERIDVSLARVRECIERLASNPDSPSFTTVEVIQVYLGRFYKDRGTPPVYSFNAQFGKLLMRNRAELGITQIASDEPVREHETHTSRWRRN
jgi:hypothetical protein